MKKKCQMCREKLAIAVARNKNLCESCFNLISIDNKKRIKFGKDIPTSYRILKEKK